MMKDQDGGTTFKINFIVFIISTLFHDNQ